MATVAQFEQLFHPVHRDERARLGLADDVLALDGAGLALSGGGIRSASFALGAVQAFLNERILERFDYLSTVSGGGYLGSGLSWWLHQAATDPQLRGCSQEQVRAAFIEQFGSKVIGARTAEAADPLAAQSEPNEWEASNWLAYIRQHGNYLMPPGVDVLSLAAVAIRVCLFSLLVYMSATVAFFCLLEYLQMQELEPYAWFGAATLAAAALLAASSLAYGPATWLATGKIRIPPGVLYWARTTFRRVSGYLLGVGLTALALWSLPRIHELLGCLSTTVRWTSLLSASGLAAIGTGYQFVVGRARSKSSPTLAQVRAVATAALVIMGLLLAAYSIASALGALAPMVGVVALGLSLLFGFAVNSNYVGLARLYRDRLMEAFLPNLAAVAENKWAMATEADLQPVARLRGRLERSGDIRPADPASQCQRPLHLINCNVVLVDSGQDIFRNRGGDSFSISNRWSGGYATGWLETPGLGDGAVSLATAMSISGAAANPNAAPNGHGVTRNRAVSFLMSLFNARLGYWMANPRLHREQPSNCPNLWIPGLLQGLLGRGLDEKARFLELTDGGHFDNTGVYELIRRRTRLIILCEAGHDAEFSMGDLANLIEKVRVDFSVFIEFYDPQFDLEGLRPRQPPPEGVVRRGFAIARVRYPKGSPTSPQFDDGLLVYLQAVPVASVSADVASFRRRNPAFPNETTADQFFDEEQLEAYRELGYGVTSDFCRRLGQAPLSGGLLRRVAEVLA